MTPPQWVLLSFALAIIGGSGLLMLPGMTAQGVELRYVDALFTSTSAVCVTGLITVDTATVFSPAGKAVIAFLIQIGGLGIMTGASFLIVLLGRRVGLYGRLVIQASLGQSTLGGLVRLLLRIIVMTAVFEGVGTILMALNFMLRYDYQPLRALGYGAFHAVSAFNNAGFALFTTNLEEFRTDWLISLVVALLIIFGGLGFPVILDLMHYRAERRLSLQTKLVLMVTAGLLVLGTAGFWLLQWQSEALAGLSYAEQALVSFFQGVTPRTAGFNTVPMGAFLPATVYLTIFLMFVGASPQSTGGGIKTTTFGVIAASMWATARGKHDVEMYSRRVPRDQVLEALTLLSAASAFVMVMTLALLADARDLDAAIALFEVISAFGTVGLSLGVTADLSDLGKLIIVLTMYVGRVGPVTLGAGLLGRKVIGRARLPEEQVPLG